MSKRTKQEQAESVEWLRARLKPGQKVYTILKSVSRSGMSRQIDLYTFDGDGDRVYLSGHAACALGWPRDKRSGAVKVSGCGMDMGFHLVYSLSYVLWPKGGGCIGEGCPSNDHSNGDRDYTVHGNGMTPHLREVLIGKDHWHSDGGYMLKQGWL